MPSAHRSPLPSVIDSHAIQVILELNLAMRRPLRNVLLAAAVTLRLQRVRVVCLRQRGGKTSADASFLLDVTLPDIPAGKCPKPDNW
jgi:hypothetical protein